MAIVWFLVGVYLCFFFNTIFTSHKIDDSMHAHNLYSASPHLYGIYIFIEYKTVKMFQ